MSKCRSLAELYEQHEINGAKVKGDGEKRRKRRYRMRKRMRDHAKPMKTTLGELTGLNA